MLRLVVALVCFSLKQQLSVRVDAAVICPPIEAISPCACIQQLPATITYLDSYSNYLNDSQASDILDAYLATPNVSPEGRLELMYNQLTRVPVQMKSFTQLEYASLHQNLITLIESGTFSAPDDDYPLWYFDLSYNKLTTIAPGASKGFYHFRLPFSKSFTIAIN